MNPTQDSSSYRPLSTSTVCMLARSYLASGAVRAEEIGDGNLNMVFRVSSDVDSVVVKQALPYLRLAGDSWPLTLDRARVEAEALELEQRFAPGYTPSLLHFDSAQAALVLEDLRGYTVWRELLVSGKEVDGVPERVGSFAAKVLLGSSPLLMPEAERRTLLSRFPNTEMCAITDDLVFTAPYVDSPTNRWEDDITDAVLSLRSDKAILSAIAKLRYDFRTRAEALIHGDLHTGSVMVSSGDTRIIDPEFACPGPIAFDVGNVLANLMLSRLAHEAAGDEWFAKAVGGMLDRFWEAFAADVRQLWPAREPWREEFLVDLLGDSARYAAAEMIRRIVGMAHVSDVDRLPEPCRSVASSHVLQAGRSLLLGRRPRSLEELWERAVSVPGYG